MSVDGIQISKEDDAAMIDLYQESSDESDIVIKQKKHKKRTPTHRQQHTPVEPARAPPQRLQEGLDMFTNPEKMRAPVSEQSNEETGSELSIPTPYSRDHQYMEDEEELEDQPSDGFQTIDDEKQDLIYKFYRMQTKGIPVNKKYNMASDVHEMRREFHRIQRDMDVNQSIKFSRRMLMACVTGMEFLNKRYDPFDVKLEGWSECVMEGIDDYDNVFEKLHDKYSSKVQMAPEIELLLSLAGSAFMFHLTNTMMTNMPNLNDIAKNNPDIIQNLMKSMAQAKPSTTTPNTEPVGSTTQNEGNVREMKPPMFDISSVMGMLNPGGGGGVQIPPPPIPMDRNIHIPPASIPSGTPINNSIFTQPIHSRTADNPVVSTTVQTPIRMPSPCASSVSVSSLESDTATKVISYNESETTTTRSKRGRKSNIKSTSENTMSI